MSVSLCITLATCYKFYLYGVFVFLINYSLGFGEGIPKNNIDIIDLDKNCIVGKSKILMNQRVHLRTQVNDTIKIDLETGKPIDTIKFEIGNVCMIARGRNAGRVGIMQHIER